MNNSRYLKVIKPGQLSLIQDFGRFGFSHLGITQGGPVDDYAYSWANYLLGNPVNLPTLEITLGQATFKVCSDCKMAITGAEQNVTLDGKHIDNWSSFTANKGQTLHFGLAKNGLRTYLAITQGFNVTPHLTSCSTVVRDKLGGLHCDGQPLQAGDQLSFNDHHIPQKDRKISFRYQPDYNRPLRLRIIEGYQVDKFDHSTIASFYQHTFRVSQHADRMGYRLEGPPVSPPDMTIHSEGIGLGAIQLPPDGQPIVLLNDRQTIGGYPKIGSVAKVDLPRLAQSRPGQTVRFVPGDLLGLQNVWSQWARFFGY